METPWLEKEHFEGGRRGGEAVLAERDTCCHGCDAGSFLKEHEASHTLGMLMADEPRGFHKCSGSLLQPDMNQLSTLVVVFNQFYGLSLGCSVKISVGHDLG